MLSGWADGLSSVPQLGQNIANIMNPNNEIQQLFKQKAATDPNFLQNLANNPEAAKMLGSLGFGQNIQNSVSAIPENAESLAAADKAKLYSQTVNNPQLRPDAASVLTTGQTTGSVRSENTRANVAEATQASDITGTNATNQQAVNNLADSSINLDQKKAILAAKPSLAGVDISSIANNIVTGQPVDQAVLSRIGMDPGASTALHEYVTALQDHMRLMTETKIANIRHDKPQNQLMFLQFAANETNKLQDQLNGARQIVATLGGGTAGPLLLKSRASMKDPKTGQLTPDAVTASQDLNQLNAAKQLLTDTSATSPQGRINHYNSMIGEVLPSLMSGIGGSTPPPASHDTSSIVEQLKTGKVTMAAINQSHASGFLSDADYNAILSKVKQPQ